jgi:2-C-methyl-D-erythritol 4-phosphate cytidylyltransferase
MPTGVVLLAAGAGRRVGGKKPKQFLLLDGEPLFLKSLRTFLKCSSVNEIVVVCLPGRETAVKRWISRCKTRVKIHLIEGGRYRGESVRNGVRALSPQMNVVLVHDAARPLISPDMVRRVEEAAKKTGAALAAWPLADTLKSSTKQGAVKKTIPRKGLWLAQTPQGFRRDVAIKCLLKPSASATDDVELAERKGYRVQLVEGGPTNMKVTYPTDLKLCRLLSK